MKCSTINSEDKLFEIKERKKERKKERNGQRKNKPMIELMIFQTEAE